MEIQNSASSGSSNSLKSEPELAQASPQPQSPPSRFFHLPRELRDEIYKYAIEDYSEDVDLSKDVSYLDVNSKSWSALSDGRAGKLLIFHRPIESNRELRWSNSPKYGKRCVFGLMLVCKQIRNELEPYKTEFYEKSTFRLCAISPHARVFIDDQMLPCWSQFRHLLVPLKDGGYDEDYTRAEIKALISPFVDQFDSVTFYCHGGLDMDAPLERLMKQDSIFLGLMKEWRETAKTMTSRTYETYREAFIEPVDYHSAFYVFDGITIYTGMKKDEWKTAAGRRTRLNLRDKSMEEENLRGAWEWCEEEKAVGDTRTRE